MILPPAAVMALGVALLAAMDATIKLLAAEHSTLAIVLVRYGFGFVAVALVAAVVRPGWPTAEAIRANAARAMVVLVAASTFYYALAVLPLADAIALGFTAPLFVALFGWIVLQEAVSGATLAALGVGFAGVVVIAWGQGLGGAAEGEALWGAVSAVVSAATYAFSIVLLRRRAARDGPVGMVLVQTACLVLLVGPVAFALGIGGEFRAEWSWVYVLVGTLGTAGTLCFGYALTKAAAAPMASLEYTAFIWAILWGAVLFAEAPTAPTLAGAALIVGSALIATGRDRLLPRRSGQRTL